MATVGGRRWKARGRALIGLFLLSSAGCSEVGRYPTVDDLAASKTVPITGGTVDDSTFDFAGLIIVADTESAALCSGSLIEPDIVLTAGHCVKREGKSRLQGAFRMRTADGRVVSRAILSAYVHPKWDGNANTGWDVAVLQLEAPITEIPPATLASTSEAPW